MRTRREFLAAAGFSAASINLVLPSVVMACGRRRRTRCDHVCNDCVHTSHEVDTGTGTGTTSCGCACPQSLYAQANGIYYYYCTCYSNNVITGNYVIAPSSYRYPSLPVSPPNCIGDCSASKDHRYAHPVHDECGFHLDPDATIPGGTTKHDAAFINGVIPQSAANLDKDINTNTPAATTVTVIGNVRYDDPTTMPSTTRHVRLYELQNKNFGKCSPFHIGFEISDPPAVGTPEPDDVGL